MDEKRKSLVFDRYGDIYRDILRRIYPAKNSTGFPERNLSVNFSKAYEAVAGSFGEKAFSWFEFQFGEGNLFHIDAVILNETIGEMFVVESKRFSLTKKVREIVEDVGRIHDFTKELQRENQDGIVRIDMSKIRRCYGVILADVWTEKPRKVKIAESYLAGVRDPTAEDSFLNRYCGPLTAGREFPGLAYDVRSMEGIRGLEQYFLVSFLWRVF